MAAKILDGKKLAQELRDELKTRVALLKSTPKVVNIMVGDADHGANVYMNSQRRTAEYVGIHYELLELPWNVTQTELSGKVEKLNRDKTIHGIMLHKPVPQQIAFGDMANLIVPAKDIEGVNAANIGHLVLGDTKIIPATPGAVLAHLSSTGISLRGKEVVIVGHSQIVGKPLSLLLLRELATVTVCHIATSEAGRLQDHLKRADVVIVAVGKANFVKGEWLKPGAVVIDVGINQLKGQTVGDVDFESASEVASYLTPVPGGVGPVTAVMLMNNAVEAFKIQTGINDE